MIDTVLCAHPLVTWQGIVLGFAGAYATCVVAFYVGARLGAWDEGNDDDP